MADLHDVVLYLCKHYPHPHELSKARLTKMVYLADWRSALERGEQLTDISWEFNYYGPYVHDVTNAARASDDFEVRGTFNPFGGGKEVINARQDSSEPDLDDGDREILDFVIEKTSRLYWDAFIKLVYSTYPVLTQPRFSILDLPTLAREHRAQQQRQPA